jgi:hypothetical protein
LELVALLWNVKLILGAKKTFNVINYIKLKLNVGDELQLISWRLLSYLSAVEGKGIKINTNALVESEVTLGCVAF